MRELPTIIVTSLSQISDRSRYTFIRMTCDMRTGGHWDGDTFFNVIENSIDDVWNMRSCLSANSGVLSSYFEEANKLLLFWIIHATWMDVNPWSTGLDRNIFTYFLELSLIYEDQWRSILGSIQPSSLSQKTNPPRPIGSNTKSGLHPIGKALVAKHEISPLWTPQLYPTDEDLFAHRIWLSTGGALKE